jgi:hypothetical protein
MKLVPLKDHLEERGILPMHKVVIDEENRVATFLLHAYGTGKLLGFQEYRPEGPKTNEAKGIPRRAYRYYPHTVEGELIYFGAESMHFNPKVLFLVEGIFDAVKFHALGLPCVACLGNNPIRLQSFLDATSRLIIGFIDNDPAGMMLAGSCDMFYISPKHDPGDMTTVELTKHIWFEPLYELKDGDPIEIAPSRDFRYAF